MIVIILTLIQSRHKKTSSMDEGKQVGYVERA
jgi:hypothetical protein